MRKLTGKQASLEDELRILRRKVVVVDNYTEGWDIEVGRVLNRLRELESRVDDLEQRLADKNLI